MNYLDIIFAIPLAWFAFKGFTKGLIIELVLLAALVLGIYISIQFSEIIGNYIGLQGNYSEILAFVITFFVVVIVLYLLGKWLENVAKDLSLGLFNNILGAAFGLLKVAFLLSVLVYFINYFDKNEIFLKKDVKKKSFLYEPLEKIAPLIFDNADKIKNQF